MICLHMRYNQVCLFVCSLDYCPSGLFGQHCEQACNCRDTRPCDKTYGTCRTPGCKPGWRGLSCNERMCTYLY